MSDRTVIEEVVKAMSSATDTASPASTTKDAAVQGITPDRAKTVLAVDDDPEWLAFVCAALGKMHPVLCASSGDDAILNAERTSPALIILDVMMPGKDGFATFCELKANPKTRSIPVIIFSQINKLTKLEFESMDMSEYLGAEPAAFLEKPITPHRLCEEVELAIRRDSLGKEVA